MTDKCKLCGNILTDKDVPDKEFNACNNCQETTLDELSNGKGEKDE